MFSFRGSGIRLFLGVFFVLLTAGYLHAAEPGLPFTEDFSDTNLKNEIKTNANWSTDEQEVYLAWRKQLYGAMSDPAVWDIGPDMDSTYAIALGDVDGDGDIDLVAGNDGTNKLYLNNGAEIPFFLVSITDIGSDTDCTRAIALGDIDGDGNLDVVAGNRYETNKLYLNNGTGNPFSNVSGTDIGSVADYTFAIALGDVDGDGDIDVVAGNDGDTNKLYLNNFGTINENPEDPFDGVSGTDIDSDTDWTLAISLGDVDGDGDLDVVVGNHSSQTSKLYLNNFGTINENPEDPFDGVSGTDIGLDTDTTFAIALGDVDGDGDIDLVAGNGGGFNKLYLNNFGTINENPDDPFDGVSGTDIGADSDSTWAIALGDVDGDGDLDVVAGNYGDVNKLYLNNFGTINENPDDPFDGVSGTDIGSGSDLTSAIALGDVDGDGKSDFVAGNNGTTNKLYQNNGTGNPFSNVSGTDIGADTDSTPGIALGDVDRDGDIDVVAGNNGDTNKLYLNNGTVNPFNGISGTDIGADTDNTYDIVLGDVDGDGDLDVVAGNSGQTNKLYLNNFGTINENPDDPFDGVSGTDIGSDTDSTYAIVLGDVDGDGDLDVVAGNHSSQTSKLYLNNFGTINENPDDPFDGVSGTDIGLDTDITMAIALGDVDGDGDLDVVAGNDGQTNKLYLNNFGTINENPDDPFDGVSGTDIGLWDYTKAIALGDVDGDGDLDVIAGNNGNTNKLYLNNFGTINENPEDPFDGVIGMYIGSDTDSTFAIALGDVDGDGDLDVVAGNYGGINKLYLNNFGTTNGNPEDPFDGVIGMYIGSDTDITYAIVLGDVDGDGNLDVVAGNRYETNKLYLNNGTIDPFNGVSSMDIGSDTDNTYAIALGDVDRDGDIDVVAGNYIGTNKLYLNNGTGNPFNSVSGTGIGSDTDLTLAIALGDVDGDGDIDVVAGNYGGTNKLYLNNGTVNPFNDVSGTDIGSEGDDTNAIALGDVDRDGNMDVVVGNWNGTNKLYLNNGMENPFNGVSGTDIGSEGDDTNAIALGDVDGDGDLDVVAGNYGGTNKLYLNNGMENPFNGVSGTGIGLDTDNTYAIALGDVDGDGDLDVVAGNYNQTNKLYLNNGTENPFNGVSGTDIGSDTDSTLAIALGDVDGDGHLDAVAGNSGSVTNRLYLNNGTVNPFNGVSGTDIGSDTDQTRAIAVGDVDRDGNMDVVVGNWNGTNKLYQRILFYHTGHGLITSIEIDTESLNNISNATLTSVNALPNNTSVDYFLSNNGGERFFQVYPGHEFMFTTQGNDLRWRAELRSLSPVLTPSIQELTITSRNIAPEATAGGTLSYTEDDPPTSIDDTITVADIDNVNLVSATVSISAGYQNGEDVLAFTNANGITGSWDSGNGILSLTGTSSVENYQAALRSVTYENIDHGNPSIEARTISFVVNDGEFDSTAVTSTVNVTRTNDPPQITAHDPDPANIVQSETIAISINDPPAPSGHIYLTVAEPDNVQGDLSLIIQSGENYSIQGNTITPVENFFGELTVPLIVYDGTDYGDVYDLSVQVDDVIDPTVSSVAAQVGGLSVDVTFSEPMGSGVTTATNYSISGSGKGTLSNNPDSAVNLYDNTYRLTWNSGEMFNGGDITITVSNVQDASGRSMGIPNSGTDIGGGIGTAPTTTAAPSGGTYDTTQAVSLNCDDGTGSGCNATFYSTDESIPTTPYSGSIPIAQYTVLKFFSVDSAGNEESVKTEIYNIDIPTTISCNLSESNITYGDSFTVDGKISEVNAANEGVSIELIPSSGLTVYLSTEADINGDFTLDVGCGGVTEAGIWTVQTSWAGDESHLGATSPPETLTVAQAGTSLTLDVLMSEAIKVNTRPLIGGNFSPEPYCEDIDLENTEIILHVTEPDEVTVHTLKAYTNQYGQYILDYDHAENGGPFDFDTLGDWTIYAEFVGTNEYASAQTNLRTIHVIPTSGYAILIQGRVASGEGLPSHHKTASFVYEKLTDRQILPDDIQFFSWIYSEGWDGDPSRANIQDAITVWARDKMDPDFTHPDPEQDDQGQPGDLYIVMIDHGWTDPMDSEEGVFYIHPDEPLTSTELSTWLADLQDNLVGTVSEDRNIVLILGFCRAGAFIDDLSDPGYPNRVIIASAAKDEASHRGPQDVDENDQPLRDGEYFVTEFFKSVSYGKSVTQCFEDATALTEAFTSSGSGAVNAPYFDDSIQHPLLDDNGDDIGSNELSTVEGEDGAFSEFLYIGTSPPEGNDPGDVLITKVNEARFLGILDTTVDLWADVDVPLDVRLIWIEVKAPNYNPEDPGAGHQIVMDTFKKGTTTVDVNRYSWANVGGGGDPADLFSTPGTYQIFYFAKDDDTGNVSPLMESKVYKAIDPNSPPYEFNLVSPENGAEVLTTFILDWEDTTDPEEDSMSYTVLLSEDDALFTDPIRIEGLKYSTCLIDPEDGIKDLTDYYWKVQAIDEYGAYTDSGVSQFSTDNTNPTAAWIDGCVYDSTTGEPILNATVSVAGQELGTELNGYYLGQTNPGTWTITAFADGYIEKSYPGVVFPDGGVVTRDFGLDPEEASPSSALPAILLLLLGD